MWLQGGNETEGGCGLAFILPRGGDENAGSGGIQERREEVELVRWLKKLMG
jgi:hypothetical protein